jgi:hypothetical protein
MPLMSVLKMRFPSVFGRPLQHYTLDKVQEIKEILVNPPFHVDKKNKTLTVTFDVSQDIEHDQWILDYHLKIKTLEQELFELKNPEK